MNLWVDCEFNGWKGALISMALVDEAGVEFYEVLHLLEPVDPWVASHVMPILEKAPVSLDRFAAALQAYLGEYDDVVLIADWPDDIAYFCRALITGPGTRIDTPTLTMQIRRDLDSNTSRTPHNALEDVRAIRRLALGLDQPVIKGPTP